MKNWKIEKFGWYIYWFDMENLPEDHYLRQIRIGWRKIFNFRYLVHYKEEWRGNVYDDEPEYIGLQYVNQYSETAFFWIGKYKIYKLYIRYNDRDMPDEKGHWGIKFNSWHNDHVRGG